MTVVAYLVLVGGVSVFSVFFAVAVMLLWDTRRDSLVLFDPRSPEAAHARAMAEVEDIFNRTQKAQKAMEDDR